MKIKGAYMANINGKRKGDPMEFTPKEKAPLAVKDAFLAIKVPGKSMIFKSATCDEIQIFPKAVPTKKPFSNNSYSAKGSFTYQELEHQGDRLYPAQTMKYDIDFEDVIDNLGMPDLKVTRFVTI